MTDTGEITIYLSDEAASIRLGEDLALACAQGNWIALSGDLGAGKSTIARAFIRALADDTQLEVPSPTFTLIQTYELRIPVSHFDLYRLGDPSELDELGFDEALSSGICLVEWPEMADDLLPNDRITLTLEQSGEGRRARISAPDAQLKRIRRVLAIRNFLDLNGYEAATRRFLTGDASSRAYERITLSDQTHILMDWPPPSKVAPVLPGKTYAEIAHIAQNPVPFVAIAHYLRQIGLASPEILKSDYEQGILVVEDLGCDGPLDFEGQPITDRYREAIVCLAYLHSHQIPDTIAVGDISYRVPEFDPAAMKIEVSLAIDWYLPWMRGTSATEAEQLDYFDIWDRLIVQLSTQSHTLVLRDFHSPNIIWRDEKSGVARVGLIDFQDAMIGPAAYDVASLIQDARVDVPPQLAEQLMIDYIALRHALGKFDQAGFSTEYAIMAAQRNCKLLGIWVRLLQRDGKPGYMAHMPRTLRNLAIALKHPALALLREWCLRVGMVLPES